MVKAFKRSFTRIVSTYTLSREEFETVVKQIQSIINSRPLTVFTNNDEAWQPLRPCNFFIASIPAPIFGEQSPQGHLFARYRHIDTVVKQVWNRFIAEYLPNLHESTRWNNGGAIPKVGDIVVSMDEARLKGPGTYPLAKIVALTGHDKHGYPMNAEIALQKFPTGHRILQRSVRTLAPVVQVATEETRVAVNLIGVSATPL